MANETLTLRVALVGGKVTEAQLLGVSAATKEVGDAARATGDKTAFAAEKTFLFGESMYSLRRYAFYALTALGATGGAILKMGFDFDETKKRSIGALTSLVGGTREATTEVQRLIALTYRSGLGLSVLTTATQQMLTFGFSVRDTNRYLQAFAVFSGKMGLGQSGVSSLSQIFNKVRAMGFMNAREFNALVGLGIPALPLLTQALAPASGYSPADLQYLLAHNQLEVSSGAALPAIAAWLQQYSARQPGSLSFQWERLHQMLSSIFGTVGKPVFNWLDQTVNDVANRLSKVTGAGNTAAILKALDPSGTLLNAWRTLDLLVKILWGSLQTLWGIASPFVRLFGAIAGAVLIVTSRFHGAAVVADVLGSVYLVHLVLEFGRAARAMKIFAAAEGLMATVTAFAEGALFALGVALLVLNRELTATDGLLMIFNLLDPFAWVAIGVVAFGLLYWKVKWFRDAVNEAFSWIRNNWPLLLEIIAAPFTFGLSLALTHLGTIWNLLKTIWGWLNTHVFHVHLSIPGAGLLSDLEHPLRALGNVFGSGPDLNTAAGQSGFAGTFGINALAKADAAQGISVSQLQQMGASQSLIAQLTLAMSQMRIDVNMEGRRVGDGVMKAKHDQEARR